METSRTNAQYKRNDRYNFLYEIEWILSVLLIFFRTTDTTDTTDTTIWKPGFCKGFFFHFTQEGLVCVINGLRRENVSRKKITCFLALKTCQFYPKMGLFLDENVCILTTTKKKNTLKIYNGFQCSNCLLHICNQQQKKKKFISLTL